MKKLPFSKMHGIGNDFIIIEDRDLLENNVQLTNELVQKMCARHTGIGSDGLIIITKGRKTDFKYIMYNPDGSQAEMCGNGIRCYMKYLRDKGLTLDSSIKVETGVGILNLSIDGEIVTVEMGKPLKIKDFAYDTKRLGDRFPIKVNKKEFIFTPISMGNPHAVIFCTDSLFSGLTLEELNLEIYGKIIENSTDIFSNRTNVEFVKILSDIEVEMRVWERGASETLACGTGACAVVVAGILSGRLKKDTFVTVRLKGGTLEVKWNGNIKDSVIMKGEAKEIFEGNYYITS